LNKQDDKVVKLKWSLKTGMRGSELESHHTG